MNDLKTTTQLVKSILEKNEAARNSDNILYLRVIEHIAEEHCIPLSYFTVSRFLKSMNILPFPPFESVRRTRQKVQATHPELASSKKVDSMRKEQEAAYFAYAVGDCDG